MTADRVKAMLDARPFRPFDVHTSDGQQVTVSSPEFAWIHPTGFTMYVCPDPEVDADEIIGLRHVTKIVNGQHKKRGK